MALPNPFRFRGTKLRQRAAAVGGSAPAAQTRYPDDIRADVAAAYDLGYRDAVAHLRAEIRYQDRRSMRLHSDRAASTTIATLARFFTAPVR